LGMDGFYTFTLGIEDII